jgi:hypothetical protein
MSAGNVAGLAPPPPGQDQTIAAAPGQPAIASVPAGAPPAAGSGTLAALHRRWQDAADRGDRYGMRAVEDDVDLCMAGVFAAAAAPPRKPVAG